MPRVRTHLVKKEESPEEFGKNINKLADGEQIQCAIECTGFPSSISGAIYSCKFGGKVFVIGVGRDQIDIPFMRLSTQEIDLQFQVCDTIVSAKLASFAKHRAVSIQ